MDLGSIAAARSQSFQEIEEKRGWKQEIGEPERKEKKNRGVERGSGDWFQSQEEGGVNTNWMETTKRRGDEEEEGRDSKGVREGLLGSGN